MDILEETYDVLEEIKNSSDYKKLICQKNLIEEKYKDLIVEFNNKKKEYEEAMTYGEHYPNIDNIRKGLMEAKTRLYQLPDIIEYKKLEDNIQKKIDYLSNELNKIINPNYKVKRIDIER